MTSSNKKITQELKPLFEPESIAVIGASNSPAKWGNWMVTRPIGSGYRGRIYPVNPRDKEVAGLKAYSNVLEIPEPVDLAIITIPASMVPDTMRECVSKGVKAAVLISAGFAETGPKGKALQDEVVKIAMEGGIRFMGPNGMGIWSSSVRLNTAFWFTPKTGGISFVSQSGTMGAYLLETANNKGYGFNSFLSVGNQADLSMTDYIEYLGSDEGTSVIVLYIEGLKDGKRFLQKAREVIKKKPIIVFKGGITENGSRATMSHTASIAGSDDVFEAMCHQAGIIRMYDVSHAFDVAEALSKQPLPRRNRVAVVSAGGGHCVVTTDACGALGLDVPELDDETVRALEPYLLPHAPPPKNPIDLAADPRPMTVANIVKLLAQNPLIDAIITMAPVSIRSTNPTHVREVLSAAEILSEIPRQYGKPLIATAMRGNMEGIAFELMRERGIPFYEFPEEAARAMYGLYRYAQIH
ncbi:MAG: CoA-binding protein [Deltaproteobacteria bacterium]|nr:CoA-binding protein [Deltaproteobacteria bacterium]MBW2052609.1 CoA-binding protein [Deltaproteobacteria bacterium]MBW2141247.1 CoA-binding protein [Deltaproteobacteria bacterium]MBW2324106.1 CoA-binding protein [Deltaproteobacteria bacterium]